MVGEGSAAQREELSRPESAVTYFGMDRDAPWARCTRLTRTNLGYGICCDDFPVCTTRKSATRVPWKSDEYGLSEYASTGSHVVLIV